MRRVILIGAAVVIGGVGLFIAIIASAKETLARESIRIGDSAIVLSIAEEDGWLYASAENRKRGSYSKVLIGEKNAVGTADPRIIVAEERVLLCIGKSTTVFDVSSDSLCAPRIAQE
jgi:hypothetical protein